MGVQMLGQTPLAGELGEAFLYRTMAQPRPTLADEEGGLVMPGELAAQPVPVRQGRLRPPADGHLARLVALAHHAQAACIEVGDVQCREFRQTQPA